MPVAYLNTWLAIAIWFLSPFVQMLVTRWLGPPTPAPRARQQL